MKKQIKRLICRAIGLSLCLLMAAGFGPVLFAGAVSYSGAGTAASPYLVTTAEQLDGIRGNLSAHYKLAATIDLSSFGNFKPIGTIAKPFRGSLTCDTNTDGFPLYAIVNLKVHTAKGPYIDEGISKWEAALFGAAENATFKNLYVLNAKISNDNYGDNRGAVVYGDYKPGMDEMNSSVLIGNARKCTVSGCGTTGVINTQSNHCGGMIGFMQGGTVTGSWSTATVTSLGKWQIAGFIGTVAENATVSSCFATGNVEGTQSTIGGFIGSVNQSMVQNCYATGNARDGFIARMENAVVANCYYTGTAVVGGSDADALGSTLSDVYVTRQVNHEGETKAGAAAVKTAFAALKEWDTSGALPVLKTTKIPADLSGYKVGAAFGTPVQTDGTPPANVPSQPEPGTEVPPESNTTVSGPSGGALMTVEELQVLIDAFPPAEAVSLENKADIVKARQAFDALSDTDIEAIAPETQKKLMDCFKALQALMVADISTRVEALPAADRLKAADQEEVDALWADYSVLEEDYKAFISEELREKLEKSVKALENRPVVVSSEAAFTTAEMIVLSLLVVVIALNAAANIYFTVTAYRKKRGGATGSGGSLDESR